MQVPIHPHRVHRKRHPRSLPKVFEGNTFPSMASGITRSLESQFKLNAFREYVGQCRSVLDEIRKNLNDFRKNPENPDSIQVTAAKLCQFYLEADSRGYRYLYDVAFALQKVLLEYGNLTEETRFWEAVDKSMDVLSALVELCKVDYRRESAVADTLTYLRLVGRNSREMGD